MADFDSMFRNWAYTFWMEQHFSNWLNDIEILFTLGDFRVVFGLKPQHFLSLQLQWLVEFFFFLPKKNSNFIGMSEFPPFSPSFDAIF